MVSSYACLLLLPDTAKPASLQLSFNVAACVAVSVSARICSFLRNPFAFANVPPLPTGLRFRPKTARRRASRSDFQKTEN
ncbi:hypothetical protein [Methanimicrococcus hongohii]|uniref:hypothetical protein n=1 Tax=Methanimicrococcus hongohii TaxID=3028295 RepID=UPI00292FD430|nr:hypothetical protein [Methanimicrococcus sp. Hf6]